MRDFAEQRVDLLLSANDDLVQLVEQVFIEVGLDLEVGQAMVDGVGSLDAAIGHGLALDSPRYLPALPSTWLTQAIDEIGAPCGPAFDEPSLLLKAVLTGQGAGLLPAAIAALDHSQGRHVKLADVSWSKAFAYYLVYPQASHELPKVATFATGFSTPWPATLPKQQPESTGSLQRQCDIQEPFRAQSSRLMNCAELRHCIAASAEPMPTFGRTAFSRM